MGDSMLDGLHKEIKKLKIKSNMVLNVSDETLKMEKAGSSAEEIIDYANNMLPNMPRGEELLPMFDTEEEAEEASNNADLVRIRSLADRMSDYILGE